jgi:hypothetical protein
VLVALGVAGCLVPGERLRVALVCFGAAGTHGPAI